MRPTTPQPPNDAPPCPFCEGGRTEVMSLFGSHASLTTCWCEDCRSPFEFLRWRGDGAAGRKTEGNMDRPAGVE